MKYDSRFCLQPSVMRRLMGKIHSDSGQEVKQHWAALPFLPYCGGVSKQNGKLFHTPVWLMPLATFA
jgi:hypothetical protein